MYPDRNTLNNVSRSGYIAARDQSMVESGVTEGWKNTAGLPVFFFVNEHNNTVTKPQAKKQPFLKLSQKFPVEEKQQLVELKDADDIRKVLLFVNHSFSGFEN